MIVKRLVCLANSRKLSGRCVAGREWTDGNSPGDWIRPVSERKGQEVSYRERQYEDGADPRVLDIVDVPLLEQRPEVWQTENWLLDPDYYWRKQATFSRFDLKGLEDPVAPLWINGDSTYNGLNDKLPLEPPRGSPPGSLRLIRVERAELAVFSPGEAFGNSKRRVQAQFRYSGASYKLWVTDPAYERKFLAKLDGVYPVGECHLTVSVGESYDGACYKLVAAIIERDGR